MVTEMRQDTLDTFYRSVTNIAKHLINLPKILLFPFIVGDSEGPMMGTVWLCCPGSAFSKLQVDKGAWNRCTKTCRNTRQGAARLRSCLGSRSVWAPPTRLPFLHHPMTGANFRAYLFLTSMLTAFPLTLPPPAQVSLRQLWTIWASSGGYSLFFPCRYGSGRAGGAMGTHKGLAFHPIPS